MKRRLLFTQGSPFARAIRIILDELDLDFQRLEQPTTPPAEERLAYSPAVQVPTFWDGEVHLWESGLIAEYLIATYSGDPSRATVSAPKTWNEKRLFSTIQTLGNSVTLVAQMAWSDADLGAYRHIRRNLKRIDFLFTWLENQLDEVGRGFTPQNLSMSDIFFAAHVRFLVDAPYEFDLKLSERPKIDAICTALESRSSFLNNPGVDYKNR